MPSSYDEMSNHTVFHYTNFRPQYRVHRSNEISNRYTLEYINPVDYHTVSEPTDINGELIEEDNTVRFISNERINLEIYKLEVDKEYKVKGVLANLILIEYNSESVYHSYFNSENFLIVPDTPLEKKSIPKEKYDKLPSYMKGSYNALS